MVRVAIVGASGYTALELIKILLRHPQAKITAVTSRQDGSPPITSVHPSLTGRLDLRCEDLSPQQIADRADVAFACLPHGASTAVIPKILAAGCKVIDLSADYRLSDPAVYEQWYGEVHTDPTRLGSTVYGLPELFASKIPGCELIANPGCYTSTSILALAPLLCAKLIEPTGIIIDAKSGVSGAGLCAEAQHVVLRVQRGLVGLLSRQAPPHTGDRPSPLRRQRPEGQRHFHTPPDPNGSRNSGHDLSAPDSISHAAGTAASPARVLSGQAVHSCRRSLTEHERFRIHELLRHHHPFLP